MSTAGATRGQIPLQSHCSHHNCKMLKAMVALSRKPTCLSMSKTSIEFLLCVLYNSRKPTGGRVRKEKDVVWSIRNIKSTYGETTKEHKIQMNILWEMRACWRVWYMKNDIHSWKWKASSDSVLNKGHLNQVYYFFFSKQLKWQYNRGIFFKKCFMEMAWTIMVTSASVCIYVSWSPISGYN